MDSTQVFIPDDSTRSSNSTNSPRTVIVELTPGGGARIREAPPDVLVMVVESKHITPAGRRTMAAGGRGEILASATDGTHHSTDTRQIPVEFPG